MICATHKQFLGKKRNNLSIFMANVKYMTLWPSAGNYGFIKKIYIFRILIVIYFKL